VVIGTGGGLGAVVIAVVLAVTLVIVPNQHAAQASAAAASASAAAAAQAAQEHQAAITAFGRANDSCTSANQQLTSSIASAQQTARTDPATMQDPTLIDKLKQAITTAQAVNPCEVPTMADDTAIIEQQTAQLNTNVQTVLSATVTVTAASQAAVSSVQAKKNADQAAKEAAAVAARTGKITLTDSDGYQYLVEFLDVKINLTIDSTQGKPGNVVVQITNSSVISYRVTNQTPGKVAPGDPGTSVFDAPMWITAVYSDNPCALLNAGPNDGSPGCEQLAFGGKTYYTFVPFDHGFGIGENFFVGESRNETALVDNFAGSDAGSGWEVAQSVAESFMAAVSSPTGWVIYDDTMGSGPDGWNGSSYNCHGSIESGDNAGKSAMCLYGGTASLNIS